MKKKILLVLFSFSLSGIKSQSLMTVGEIYDFDMGDVFITKAGGYNSPPTYEKKIITNRYYSAMSDTVFYNYVAYYYTPAACQTCNPVYDTTYGATMFYTNLTYTVGAGLGVKTHYLNGNCIDTTGYTGVWVDTVYYNPNFCNRQTVVIMRLENGPFLIDSCYSYFEPFYGYEEYGKGIGQKSQYYNSCSGGNFNCEQGVFLLYYKKGSDSCGTAPLMSYVNELKNKPSFKIFPNPLSTETNISFFEEQINSVITVTNIIGEEVLKLNFSGRVLTLEKIILKSGIYFVGVNDRKGFYSSKLIVQ
jgi:hypothetical protein